MQNNIHKISERGERLDNLQDKTDHLSTQANSFRRGANRVRKQMWWKDMKMRMCIIIGIIILLVIIIVPSGEFERSGKKVWTMGANFGHQQSTAASREGVELPPYD